MTLFPNESRPPIRIISLDICLASGHNYKHKRCTMGNMSVFHKDVNEGRFKRGSQLIFEQYQNHRLVGLISHMGKNWIYISRNTADYTLSSYVRLHVTLSFVGPRKSTLYLKTIFRTYFVCMFYMYCQQVAPVNLFLLWI
jgi:hypothetical protein